MKQEKIQKVEECCRLKKGASVLLTYIQRAIMYNGAVLWQFISFYCRNVWLTNRQCSGGYWTSVIC